MPAADINTINLPNYSLNPTYLLGIFKSSTGADCSPALYDYTKIVHQLSM